MAPGDRPCLISFLNSLEGFAPFFVSGIAEEKVGYQETATSFKFLVLRSAYTGQRRGPCGGRKKCCDQGNKNDATDGGLHGEQARLLYHGCVFKVKATP